MISSIKITFSDLISAKLPGMCLGNLVAENLTVTRQSPLVNSATQELTQFILQKFAERPPSADPVISAVRRMYRRIGWEPTQYRPAAEALIRRILKGTGLYQVNNLVDLANIISTRFHLPMGLYDLDKIKPGIEVDVGRAGESYQGIYKDLIHAEGKLVLRDSEGIFGNPTADSARTCINPETKNILAIFFTPAEVEPSYLDQTLAALAALYQQECPQCSIEKYFIKP
jgi:DNA/RNA-binding domain of Phe-tRNA-synthetase-like protein